MDSTNGQSRALWLQLQCSPAAVAEAAADAQPTTHTARHCSAASVFLTSQQLASLWDVGGDNRGQRQQVLLQRVRHACEAKGS